MIYELRQYWSKPGQRDALVALLESEIFPMQVAGGVRVVASFADADDPDHYVWIRGWESLDERQRVTDAVYGSAHWLDDLKPRVHALMQTDRTTVALLGPTATSPMQ